jgi:hypothetical protein
MQSQPSDYFVFGIICQVLWEHRISGDMWPLQVVEEVTEIDERKWHDYCVA